MTLRSNYFIPEHYLKLRKKADIDIDHIIHKLSLRDIFSIL